MNKKSLVRTLLFGIAIYTCTIIYKLPANLLKPIFTDDLPIQIDTLSGSIWNGSIHNVRLKINNGLINIGQLHWQLRGYCLLSLHICSTLELKPNLQSLGDIYITTDTKISLDQTLSLRNIDAHADAGWLLEMAALPISAAGSMTVNASKLIISPEAGLPTIFGEIRWQDAGIDYPEEYQLGNYAITLDTVNGHNTKIINGALRDENGLISSNGTLNVFANGQIDINLQLRPTAQTPDSLASLFNLIGHPDSNGNYNVRHKTFIQTIL